MRALSTLLVVAALLAPVAAAAHMVVVPAESVAGGWERYSLLVPTEHSSPTVRIELRLPAGLEIVALEAVPGWEGRHDPLPIGAATLAWTGGRIPPTQFVVFEFLAWNPPAARTITWIATQWYEDGTSDRWDGPPDAFKHASTTRLRPGSGKERAHAHPPAGKGAGAPQGHEAERTPGHGAAEKGQGAPAE